VGLEGELDISSAPPFAARVSALLDAGIGQVVLDVSRLTFVDVAGLRALLALRVQAEQQLTAVRLTGASTHLRRVLAIVSPAGDSPPRERHSAEPVTGRPLA
jgi:anti-anti-sigma factor